MTTQQIVPRWLVYFARDARPSWGQRSSCTPIYRVTWRAPPVRVAQADVVTPNLADWKTDAVHHLFD